MIKPVADQADERKGQWEEYEPIRLIELGSVSEMTRGNHVLGGSELAGTSVAP